MASAPGHPIEEVIRLSNSHLQRGLQLLGLCDNGLPPASLPCSSCSEVGKPSEWEHEWVRLFPEMSESLALPSSPSFHCLQTVHSNLLNWALRSCCAGSVSHPESPGARHWNHCAPSLITGSGSVDISVCNVKRQTQQTRPAPEWAVLDLNGRQKGFMLYTDFWKC